YGPGYRIYEGGDGGWFALVVPDAAAWARLRSLVPSLPAEYAPIRGGDDDATAREAEAVLAAAFSKTPGPAWVDRLRAAGLLAEAIVPMERDSFRIGILDDP